MPGSEQPNLDQLDYPALQNFIDTDVSGFLRDLDTMRSPDAHPTALYDVQNKAQPLTIGPMENDDETGGKSIVENAKKAAGAIDNVFRSHKEAFTKIQTELGNVIKNMKDAEAKNLSAVESQKFMTEISGYVSLIGGGTSTNTGSGTGSSQNSLNL
ncbi:type VII secretion system-associated protein [Streptomyces sp. NPDC005799]|uniref:type VII secretion system-associated protein n=1 Tax=Streptomyces sp. NPDC005799 TaxID=3154678 RepID=UPI0033F5E7C4